MADIFVSYSQKDRERVVPLVDVLESYGWSVWWDNRGSAGEKIDEMVERELASANCVVVVWSCASIESDWVREEADDARIRGKLVPIKIDDVRPPRPFGRHNVADLRAWTPEARGDEFEKFVTGVERLVPRAHDAQHAPNWSRQTTPSSKVASVDRHGSGFDDWLVRIHTFGPLLPAALVAGALPVGENSVRELLWVVALISALALTLSGIVLALRSRRQSGTQLALALVATLGYPAVTILGKFYQIGEWLLFGVLALAAVTLGLSLESRKVRGSGDA
jgi:hypothetical protein